MKSTLESVDLSLESIDSSFDSKGCSVVSVDSSADDSVAELNSDVNEMSSSLLLPENIFFV